MLKNKNTFLLLLATVFTASANAQPTLLPAKPVVTNYMEILMISVALLLVVVVWVLANVLMMVSKKAVEHAKSNPKIMMILILAFLLSGSFAQAKQVAIREVPSMTDAWYESLETIKADSEDGIITITHEKGNLLLADLFYTFMNETRVPYIKDIYNETRIIKFI